MGLWRTIKTEHGHRRDMSGKSRGGRPYCKMASRRLRRRVDAAEALHGIWSWMSDEQFEAICNSDEDEQ